MTRTSSSETVPAARAAAAAVLAREGPGGLTIRAVAAEAGIAPQSIYNRFGSRQELLDDVAVIGYRRLIERLLDLRGDSLAEVADPLMALIEVLRRYQAAARAEPELHRFLFRPPADGYVPSTRAQEVRREAIELIETVVARAITGGALLPGEPAETAGRLLAAAEGGLRLEWADLEVDGDAAVATMIRGLRPSAQLR